MIRYKGQGTPSSVPVYTDTNFTITGPAMANSIANAGVFSFSGDDYFGVFDDGHGVQNLTALLNEDYDDSGVAFNAPKM